MRRHLRNPWVWVAAAVLCALWLFWPRTVKSPGPAEIPAPAPVEAPASTPATNAPLANPGASAARDATRTTRARRDIPDFLPPEALRTLALIERGGPFPYRQDGGEFGNREGRLPQRPRGWYREYTVDTPGLSHRGARRIVTGGHPPEVWYYTDDHYDSFRAFEWTPGTRAEALR